MNIQTAIQDAARGKVLPAYLVGGDERLLLTRCLDAVRVATVGAGPRGLSEDHFEARQTTAATILQACRTLPMMARRRLVVVRGVDHLPAAEQELLATYFAAPSPSTVLVLVADRLDARRRIALEAKKHGCLFDAATPSESELGPWLEREATQRGVTLEPGAVESLTLAVGPDLAALSDALERLQLYTAGAPVTAHDVDTVVTPVREVPAWDLADAIGTRNTSAALSILARLVAQRAVALPTLGLIARQVHLIARAQAALADGHGASLASTLKVHPYAAQKIAGQARKWSVPQVHRALRVLAAADAALKNNRRGDARVLEECVLALCGARALGESSTR